MVIVEQSIRALLVQANVVERRVYLMRAPQKPSEGVAPPYCVFFPVGSSPVQSHSGPTSFEGRLYQVSVFDNSQSRALAIADTLRARLNGFSGTLAPVTFGSILLTSQTWMFEDDTRLYQIIQEYAIRFRVLDPAVPNPQ